MSRPSLPVPALLDDAVDLVSEVAAPWLGVLWILSLPLRLAQGHFVARVHEFGEAVHTYGNHLGSLALVTSLLLVVSLLGRACFAHTCSRRLRGLGAGEGAALPSLGAVASYVFAALLVEVVFYLSCISFVLAPLFIVIAGLLAATLPQLEGAGPLRPFGAVFEALGETRALAGLVLVFSVAVLLAFVNVFLVFQLGLWLASGVAGFDVGRYGALMDLRNPRFICLVTALTVGLVEPWWLATLVIFVHRKRSLSTGEDLRVWFARLSKADGGGAALLVLALVLPGVVWAQQTEPPSSGVFTYARAAESVAVHLEAGRLDAARLEARALSAFEYEWAGESLGADRALVRDIALAKTTDEARAVALRVRRLVIALDAVAGTPAGAAPQESVDVAALVPEDTLEAGGTVERVEMSQVSFPERVARAILDTWDALAAAVADLWDRFWDFVERIWPKTPRGRLADGSTSPLAIAFVVVVALVLVVLSIRALRRRHRAVPVSAESEPVVSARDDDPLSRESNEWEIHAQKLGAAGRWREAIRAWYHAVLVALFRAGLVHYQKGRTNWEYASRLAPEASFRPAFFDLTRLFDREWYGRRTSDAEAHRSCARSAKGILDSLRQAGGES